MILHFWSHSSSFRSLQHLRWGADVTSLFVVPSHFCSVFITCQRTVLLKKLTDFSWRLLVTNIGMRFYIESIFHCLSKVWMLCSCSMRKVPRRHVTVGFCTLGISHRQLEPIFCGSCARFCLSIVVRPPVHLDRYRYVYPDTRYQVPGTCTR
jgi:hypothetical protein